MAFVYETGVPTSQQDFVQKLFTFLTANGWTQDQLDTTNKQAAIHKGTCYVSFRWDSQASPNGAIGVCQALGYTGGQSPGNHPNDSGNGQNTGGNITVGRRMPWIGNGPFTSYHFFLDTTADVFHGVLEFQAGLYRHLSFGTVAKVGTWTGGEFCGALYWNNAGMDNLLSSNHSVMWDLYYSTGNDVAATIHVEGLPNAPANSRWGSFWGGAAGSVGNDRAGNGRCNMGGTLREGPIPNMLAGFGANPSNGFVPMSPVWVFYRYRTPSPEDCYMLGYVPNVRGINVRYLEPGEEFVLGSETWKVFPWVRKANQGGGSQESKYQGIAYRKA